MNQLEVIVFFAQGGLEENQVRSFLAAHGIPTSVRGEALRHTHGFILDGLGQVEISVAASDECRARELLAQVESGALTLQEDMQESD